MDACTLIVYRSISQVIKFSLQYGLVYKSVNLVFTKFSVVNHFGKTFFGKIILDLTEPFIIVDMD